MRFPGFRPCLPQTFLRTGGTLTDLSSKYGIDCKRHKVYNNLVQLKYSQLDSPMDSPIVQQSRGVILDENRRWDVVARPIDKFFNHVEELAHRIDWATAHVQEKLDGSSAILYWYDNDWRVGTLGSPDASGAVNGLDMTFAHLFWKVWNMMGYSLPISAQQCLTFQFELMTPFNKVVVQHESSTLKLVAVRNCLTGNEVPAKFHVAFRTVEEFGLKSIEEIHEAMHLVNPLRQEGYVVVDKEFNRIKIKHPGYVAIHHLRDSLSPRKILEAVRAGETSEMLVYFPEWKDAFEQVQAAYDGLAMHLESEERRLRVIPPGTDGQKAFALEAKNSPCSGALFAVRNGRATSIREALKVMHVDGLMDTLGVRTLHLTLPEDLG